MGATGTCIDHGFRPKPGEQGKLVPCNGKVTQRWMALKKQGLRPDNDLEKCLMNNEITYCDWREESIAWEIKDGLFKHVYAQKGLAANAEGTGVGVETCDSGNPRHRWQYTAFDTQHIFDKVKEEAERLQIPYRVSEDWDRMAMQS